MFKRIWTIFKSRNREFFRDRSAFLWNLLFPFLIIIGFGFLFNDANSSEYRVGYIDKGTVIEALRGTDPVVKRFFETKHVSFIKFESRDEAVLKLTHHKLDMVVDFSLRKFWVSGESPKGYISEKILSASEVDKSLFTREKVNVREIPYVEWLFPGILAMNIMFSALFGVGYVVVRYRKNGALKRMSVTPVHPWEFLSAQILSRLYVSLATTIIVYAGCALVYKFECKGSYALLLFIFALGTFCMIALGLLIASRSSSEEFASGVLNLITWPMMFFSEVWFSLEGARPWAKQVAQTLPLTHMVDAARKVMNDGATLYDLKLQIGILLAMSAVFIVLGSFLFKWQRD